MPLRRLAQRLRERPYRHERPHRPSRLPRRLTPPPERKPPPDLTLFLYAGLALVTVLLIVAIPYVVRLVIELLAT